MKTAIISVTEKGAHLGQQVKSLIAPTADCYEKEGKGSRQEAIYFSSMKDIIGDLFKDYDRLLCIMATGIVVRMIAPYIVHKSKDPAIVVMDELGKHVISLLSGHLGGANEWTTAIGMAVKADPVITTATDVNGLFAPDVFARQQDLQVDDFKSLIAVNAAIIGGKSVTYYVDKDLVRSDTYVQTLQTFLGCISVIEMIDVLSMTVTIDGAIAKHRYTTVLDDEPAVLITDKLVHTEPNVLVLRPKTYTIGIGCRRNTPKEYILEAIHESLGVYQLSPKSIKTAASVNVKADEVGLLAAMKELEWPIEFYDPQEMSEFIEQAQLEESNFVKETIGVGNVCETTALLAAKSNKLIQPKTIFKKTTVAIALVTSK